MKKPPFILIFEDTRIAVLNKESGIAVSPDRWDPSAQRLDKLAAEFLNLKKIYTVHRIDRDTSGLVIFAKTGESHKALSEAFENRLIKKRYIAVIHGRPSWNEATCDLPLVPNGNKQHLTIIDKFRGKKSFTRFVFLGTAGNYSVLEAFPETGRTHQIRVHLSALGHPVVCDELYGKNKPVLLSSIKRGWRGDPLEERPLLSRLGLHASELFIPGYISCVADTSGEADISGMADADTVSKTSVEAGLKLKAPLPRDMAALARQMEKIADREFGLE